jgi:hypothetical protein
VGIGTEELRDRERLRNQLRAKLVAVDEAIKACARGRALTADCAMSLSGKVLECTVALLYENNIHEQLASQDAGTAV